MKKRIAALFLTLVMALCAVQAMAEIPIIASTDVNLEEYTVDPADPLKCFISGMIRTDLTLEDGTARTLYQYIPETVQYRQASVAIAIPTGADPVEFIETTGWKAQADEQGFTLIVITAGDQGWQHDESAYTAATYKYMNDRTYLYTEIAAFYMVGYGDGANAVMAHAVVNSEKFSGFAAFGVDAFDVSVLETGRTTPSNDPEIMKSEVKVPVWFAAAEETESVKELRAYWQNANELTGTDAVRNDYADEIYTYPVYMIKDYDLTDMHVATVRVTWDTARATTPEFTNELWNNFLRRVRRQESAMVNALRAFATNAELGMDTVKLVVDGVTREFDVYVPTAVKEGKVQNVPVVFSYHGNGGSGESFSNRTSWNKTAEERQFICVFPTGSRTGNFKPTASWREEPDIEFFKVARAYVLENYSVDKTRVYVTGQSMGSAMTWYVVLNCPELIAAAAPNDGLLNMELYQEAKLDVVMPVIFNVGTLDKHFMEGGRNYQQTSEVMKIMASWYGNTKTEEETFKYQTGRFYGYVWTNKDGLPVLQEQWVVDKIHAMIPEETYLLYDFMANYTRGVDGTSYYMGVAIEK